MLAGIAVGVAQRGLVQPAEALGILAGGLVLSGFALGAALSAAVSIWRTGHRGTGRIVTGVTLAALTLAYPAFVFTKLIQAPDVVDLATDAAEPPASAGAVPKGPARRSVADIKTVLSDFEPILLDEPPAQAFATTTKALRTLRWRLVSSTPPTRQNGVGHLDATTQSTIMRLPEDIAIRLTAQNGQTRVDIRSASRLDLPDLGDNARNIRALADTLEDLDTSQ